MTERSDLALMVEERGHGEFYWVLIESIDNDEHETLHYRRFMSATTPQSSYSNALALGAAALRRLADTLAPPGSDA